MTTPRPTLGTPLLKGMLIRLPDHHLRNSATALTLRNPKREFLKRSFKHSGAMLWNQPPNKQMHKHALNGNQLCVVGANVFL